MAGGKYLTVVFERVSDEASTLHVALFPDRLPKTRMPEAVSRPRQNDCNRWDA